MIYYINVNKKRIVGRNNQISTRPLNLEYDVTEVIDFQFIDDNNQIQPLSPQTACLTLAIGLKQNMPSYDLLALSHDYEIVNGQILRFTVNTYTVNWLKKINKPNTEVFIEISQQSLESKKVWMRDYCYVWPRVYTAGLEPEEIASNDYYTKAETDEAIENAIEGIELSGYVTTEEFEEGLATKADFSTVDSISGQLEEVDEMLEDYVELRTPFYAEAVEAGAKVTISKNHNTAPTLSLKYSRDNITWLDYTIGNQITLSNAGDKVYFKGNNDVLAQSLNRYNKFTSTANVNVGGNIMSLLDETMLKSSVSVDGMQSFFYNNEKIVDASKLMLPAMKLSNQCYYYMFGNCTALIKPPKVLPAIYAKIGCYQRMFSGCSSLIEAPEIKAIFQDANFIAEMFNGASSLKKVKVHFTTFESYYSSNWLNNVAASGTFYCSSALDTTTRDASHVPEGWTVVNF